MATTASPEHRTHSHDVPRFNGVLRRPLKKTGVVGWLTTVDHKRIGIGYGIGALIFFLIGGVEALIIRLQLISPMNDLIDARTYNQLFTMHGTTMVFLAVMPLSSAFFNYVMPLQIGARDVAFPRLNSLGLWTFVFGGILLNLSWFFQGGAPDVGWFGYAPLTDKQFSPTLGTDFWMISLQLLGIASIAGAVNFITTIINMRAPGLTMMRLPVFTWMTLFTSFLLILALPPIAIALTELMFDRHFGAQFFNVAGGGKPILWQHLFWIFGHPEVYILILPAMGIVSEVLPTFARKPLFGYPLIVFSGAVIGFLGFTVWSHHMFTTGLGVVATTAFSFLTMLIAIPTGVKIFNWIGTMWGGSIRFTVPMLFSVGFVGLFMIGGLTGIMHASVPVDSQQQDSYFVIAHFHYVLIGGSIFALFSGIYYWFPKISGRMMSELVGKVVFYTMFVGFNLAFFPHHLLGMTGMPRRTHTYKTEMGWDTANFWSTIGALILGIGILIFIIDLVRSAIRGKPAGRDPWDARTLEWATTNPPKEYNFAYVPRVHARDQIWENKYGRKELKMDIEAPDHHGIHMPDQSWWPFLCSFGLFVFGLGIIFHGQPWERIFAMFWLPIETDAYVNWWQAIVPGIVLTLGSIYGWALEGPGGYHLHPDDEDAAEIERLSEAAPGK